MQNEWDGMLLSNAKMLSMNSNSVVRFRAEVWKHYTKSGRSSLPWRKARDSYQILVSEVMLQQTQVSRVQEKYREFLRAFPNVHALARSDLATVLQIWSGMGYNRRAKFLRDAAIAVVKRHQGCVPRDYELLRALPGVGDYTARAIRVFAFNEPDTLIETNIRAAAIHHFYRGRYSVKDDELLLILRRAAEGQDPRTWYWALMDYGAHLKRLGVRNNYRSAHYIRQSKFEGSLRQARGAILRELMRGTQMSNLVGCSSGKFRKALASLAHDGLIVTQKGKWRIA